MGSIRPKYPESARQRGQEGTLKLMVRIDELGRVREVEVMEAHPAGIFEEVSLEAFRNARFHPAIRDGQPVRIEAYMRVEFRLE
jgi:protein TonB